MKGFLLCSLVFACVAVHSASCWSMWKHEEPDVCTPSREEATACARKYVDTDHDGLVTVKELDAARDRNLSWLERMISSIAAESNERILAKCDVDGDGFISEQDFAMTNLSPAEKKDPAKINNSCLVKCASIEKFFKYLCKREEAREKEANQ